MKKKISRFSVSHWAHLRQHFFRSPWCSRGKGVSVGMADISIFYEVRDYPGRFQRAIENFRRALFKGLYFAEFRQSKDSAAGQDHRTGHWLEQLTSAQPITQWPRQAERWERSADASDFLRLLMEARAVFINRVFQYSFRLILLFYLYLSFHNFYIVVFCRINKRKCHPRHNGTKLYQLRCG